MKDLIIEILASLHDGSLKVTKADYSITGSCVSFECELPSGQTFRTTAQHYEIIASLLDEGLIIGHDPHTKRVFVKPTFEAIATPMRLFEIMPPLETISNFEEGAWFTYALLNLHLNNALNILDYEGDPEELWVYFDTYNLIEKQALLWMLSQKPHIVAYEPRKCYADITNYLEGVNAAFDRTTPLNVQMFARWLKQNDGGLLSLAPPAYKEESRYAVSTT